MNTEKIQQILDAQANEELYWRWHDDRFMMADYESGLYDRDENFDDHPVWFFRSLRKALEDYTMGSWELGQEIIRNGGRPVLVGAVAERIEDCGDETVDLYNPDEVVRFYLTRDEAEEVLNRLEPASPQTQVR